jgi:hypothetical protein
MKAFKVALASMLAIAAMSAIATAGAQAAESEWMIGTQTLAELSLSEEQISLSGGPVSLSVPSKGITVECKTAEKSDKIIKGGSEELTMSLTKCEVVKLTACKVSEPLVLESKSSFVLAGGLAYQKMEALKEGKPLATVVLTGKECALAEHTEVTGSVVGEISLEEHVKQPLKFSEKISKTANAALKEEAQPELALLFGKQAAFLSGELSSALSGKNIGMEFQDVPITRLCKTNPPPNNVCGGGVWGINEPLKMEQAEKMKFTLPGGTSFVCDESKFAGTVSQNAGDPLLASFTSASFTTCKTAGNVACSVMPEGLPYTVQLKAITNAPANMGIMKILNPKFKAGCTGGAMCLFEGIFIVFKITGGAPAKIARDPTSLVNLAGACIGTLTWEGVAASKEIEYKFTAPGTPPEMWVSF